MSLIFEAFELDGLNAYLHLAYDDRPDDQAYIDMIWELTEGLNRYAIPRYHRNAGTRFGEPYALVDWEYEVESEPDSRPTRNSIRGFVPARSAVPGLIHFDDPPTVEEPPYAVSNAGKAGLFPVLRPVLAPETEILFEVVKGLQADASAEVNLFAIANRPARLVEALSQSERPRLADVLSPEDVFVDLVIGVDIGYSNVLLIQSHSDLSAKLARIDG